MWLALLLGGILGLIECGFFKKVWYKIKGGCTYMWDKLFGTRYIRQTNYVELLYVWWLNEIKYDRVEYEYHKSY